MAGKGREPDLVVFVADVAEWEGVALVVGERFILSSDQIQYLQYLHTLDTEAE